jgi:voltage-gated potassium channel
LAKTALDILVVAAAAAAPYAVLLVVDPAPPAAVAALIGVGVVAWYAAWLKVGGLLLRRSDRNPVFGRLAVKYAAADNLKAIGAAVFLIFTLHTFAMVLVEGMDAGTAAWFAATTMATVGYGDVSPHTALGRLLTVLLNFVPGIAALSAFFGAYFEFKNDRRERKRSGQWRWKMEDHIVVLGEPSYDAETFFRRFVHELRFTRKFRHTPVMFLTTLWEGGVPTLLNDLGVVHYRGGTDDLEAIRATGVDRAKAVVVLTEDTRDRTSDDLTFSRIDRLRHTLGVTAPIVAECLDDDNRGRMRRAGADVVVRPMRGYPSILVRSLVAPGSEKIIENLFSGRGDELVLFNVPFGGRSWAEVQVALVSANLGVALAYLTAKGDVVFHPESSHRVEGAQGLFLLCHRGVVVEAHSLAAALGGREAA